MLILFNYRSFDFLCRRNDLLCRRKDLLSSRNGSLCLFCRSDELTSSPKGKDRSPESQHGIIKQILTLNKECYPVENLQKKKQLFTIPTRILLMMMCIQNLVSFCQFVLKILSKNRILTLIKGSNSVANLGKTKIYNTNIDLVNDNVYTRFGLNLFILSQDIEQKPNSDINQER